MFSVHKTIIISLSMLTLLSCTQTDTSSATHSDSIQTNKPTKRKSGYIMPGLEHGFEQSPINIHSSDSSSDHAHKITLYYKDDINKIENLGHTVQLDFQEGSNIIVDDTSYAFKQCHFHTPSEHLIDGIAYAMEMHIVNVLPNTNKENPQYVVIGILFKEGKENLFIKDFINNIPKKENSATPVNVGVVKLSDLFEIIPSELKGNYYNYRGSLTTPPYTESVRWFISKHIFEASAEQIALLHSIEGSNARHVQALYGRSVVSE